MKKKTKIYFMIAALIMVLSFPVNSEAATVVTDPIGSSIGYTLYVRKSGSTAELGQLYMATVSSQATSTFTASTACKATTAYASGTNSGYASKGVASLLTGASVIAKKSISGTTHWGYCSVAY